MLRRFQIKNFRSCKNVVLEGLGSLTGLIGRNGSGKTNLLRAIAGLGEGASATGLFPSGRRILWEHDLSAEIEVDVDGTYYRYTYAGRNSPTLGEAGPRTITLRESLAIREVSAEWKPVLERRGTQVHFANRSKAVALGATSPCLPALNAMLPEGDDLQGYIRPILTFLSGIRYYPLDEASEAPAADRLSLVPVHLYEQWAADYQATGEAGESVLMRLVYAHRERPQQFDEIEALLGPKGLGLIQKIMVYHIDPPEERIEPGTLAPRYFGIRFRLGRLLGGGSEQHGYGNLSLGTRRVLALIVSLILDRSSLMLVEHPEDGIHRGLVRKLIDLLRANADPVQIILSSHSGVVLNALAPEDIRLVTIRRGATEVRALTPKETAAAERYIDEEGTLSEFLESVTE